MELKQFDLNGLTILWQASIRNENLRAAIEQELQVRILTNTNFSREYFFWRMQNEKSCYYGIFHTDIRRIQFLWSTHNH